MTRQTPHPWTGATLRAAMEVANLTPYGLAKRLRAAGYGTQTQTVDGWLGNYTPAREPGAMALRAVSRVLGVSMEGLCGEDG